MADETGYSGIGGPSRQEQRNLWTEPKQRIGGGQMSREPETGGRVGGEGHVSQQSNADADGPSRQTSTAKDEEGQL